MSHSSKWVFSPVFFKEDFIHVCHALKSVNKLIFKIKIMKHNYQNLSLPRKFRTAFFFAFAFLFVSQNSFAQCPVNGGVPFTQQMGIGSNNKMILGGYGSNDGTICWNCYNDSTFYGRSRSFNMPSMGFPLGSPVPHWSSRITQDIVGGIFRIQNGLQSVCYDSIQWNGGISLLLNGNVGIGTDNTFGYKLAVNGKIIAKDEIRSTLTGVSWPDYVFAPTYKLKPLFLLEKEIKTLGHLPEMPTAKEVETEGLSLTGVTTTLVKKVEELTLYTIDQQKEIEELKEQNKKLQEAVTRLLEENE